MKKILAAVIAVLGLAASACGECSLGCIARGARVRVPGGSRRIEELQVGDEVLCVDPATGRHIETRITSVRRVRRECVALQLEGTELVCTTDHPLYSPEDATWAPAGDWAVGNRTVLALSDGAALTERPVRARRLEAGVHEVFDLSIEHPLHNFVANDVLVHNKANPRRCGAPCTCPSGARSAYVCETTDAGDEQLTCDCD